MAGEIDVSRTEDDSTCLDLSIKQIWLIVRYPVSDPGNEFEIVSDKQLVGDSWETLERGVQVIIAYGNAKVQATVLAVSDDLQYLQRNFASITEEYSEKEQVNSYVKVKKEVIKVADRWTQTEEDLDKDVLRDYTDMKRKYKSATQEIKRIKLALKQIKGHCHAAFAKIDAIDREEEVDEKPEINSRVLTDASNTVNNGKITNGADEIDNGDAAENDKDVVRIGPGKTKISRANFESISWANYSAATRKLLILLFPRNVLATHSLTGKPSPAFITRDKETKMRLNPTIVSDIVDIVSKKCRVSESLVRNAITTKCADENKMYKKRLEKKKKENIAAEKNCRPAFK